MTNKVKLEVEKDVESYQTIEFSTRFNQEQVDGWLKSKDQETDFWLYECGDGWTENECPDIRVHSPEVENDQGDDHCPYDDEIQEWLNENQDQ